MTRMRNEKGFTLIEVVAAIAVFAFGMLALYRLQAATVVSNSLSNQLSQANMLAQDRMEELRALPYKDPADGSVWLNDVDDDGGRTTNRDANGNGWDDGDEAGGSSNFGLNDTVAGGAETADGCITIDGTTNIITPNCAQAMRPGIDFRLYHNIAVNQPLPNTKTIRIIANWLDKRNILHRSVYTSMKADFF